MNPFRYCCKRLVYMRAVNRVNGLVKCDTNVVYGSKKMRPLGFVKGTHVEVWIKDTPLQRMTEEQSDYIYNVTRVRNVKVYCYIESNYRAVFSNILVFRKGLQWVPVTKIKNAVMEDHLADFIEASMPRSDKRYDGFLSYLFDRGVKFEGRVMDVIRQRYPNMGIKVAEEYEASDPENYRKTRQAMKDGYGIIYQATLWNTNNRTYGSADMLVRSDFLAKLFPAAEGTEWINAAFPYYVVVDVKLSYNADLMPYYRSQLYLYNEALSQMQHYDPGIAFIYAKDGLHMVGWDEALIRQVDEALEWYRNITSVSTSDPRLMPNMKAKSGNRFKGIKKRIAQENHEITQLWNVTLRHRNIAVQNGISSLLHPGLTAELMGIHGKKAATINALLESYRSSQVISGTVDDFGGWTRGDNYYLDIETINMKIFDAGTSNIVFMIGIGWEEHGQWKYVNYHIERLDELAEKEILVHAMELLKHKRVFHWGTHEKSVLLPKFAALGLDVNELNMYDMNRWFIENKIVIKGMLNFKLKSVCNALSVNNLTDMMYDDMEDGLDAMYQAWKMYTNGDFVEYDKLIRYNEKDCMVMKEIHRVLKAGACGG